eukprot:IDg20778t1
MTAISRHLSTPTSVASSSRFSGARNVAVKRVPPPTTCAFVTRWPCVFHRKADPSDISLSPAFRTLMCATATCHCAYTRIAASSDSDNFSVDCFADAESSSPVEGWGFGKLRHSILAVWDRVLTTPQVFSVAFLKLLAE